MEIRSRDGFIKQQHRMFVIDEATAAEMSEQELGYVGLVESDRTFHALGQLEWA